MNRTRWIIDLEPILRVFEYCNKSCSTATTRSPHVSTKLVEAPRYDDHRPSPVVHHESKKKFECDTDAVTVTA
jgi:hypothetical protein